MPFVQSCNPGPRPLKLSAGVHLPPPATDKKWGDPVEVKKEQWKKCCSSPFTVSFMARGLVRLAPATSQAKNAASKTKPSPAPAKKTEPKAHPRK